MLQVFAVNGDIRNDKERAGTPDRRTSTIWPRSAMPTKPSGADGAIDLASTAPDRGLRRLGEQQERARRRQLRVSDPGGERYGNGDHVFTVDEQTNAINALYDVARGEQQQLGVGRRARLGFEINF